MRLSLWPKKQERESRDSDNGAKGKNDDSRKPIVQSGLEHIGSLDKFDGTIVCK